MLSDIENKLKIIDDDNDECVLPCIDVHLIINKKLEEVSTIVDTVYTSFLKEFDSDFTFCWYYDGKQKKATRIQKEKLRAWLKDKKKLKGVLDYNIHSAKSLSDTVAAPYFSFFYTRNVIDLRLSFPVDYAISSIKKIITNVLKECPIAFGYGGYSLLFEDDFAYNKNWTSLYVERLKNYPGLVFSEANAFGEIVLHDNKIPVVNWLTVLGDNFIDVLGGKGKIKQSLSNHFEFIDHDHAICIFAGSSPQLGNKTASSLPLYQEIGKLLKPICMNHKRFENTGVAGMKSEEAIDWHMRFFN